MNDGSKFTKQYVKECFDYCDGELIWRKRPEQHFSDTWHQKVFNTRQAGSVAGTLVSGYRVVNFKQRRIAIHRLVFLWHYGYFPSEIDHIDGNPLNNRIENLRPASHADNCKNMKIYKSNTSGFKGVSFHKATGKWAAGIRLCGKWTHLGLFDDINEAAMRRKDVELSQYGEFSRGR
jgi:hypothetical protein